jgi:tRNA G18 (ribose-2'-O)-methylase SpoU
VPRIFIDNLNDERLAPFRDLRNRNPTRLSGIFVVESRLLVERLLKSDHEIKSLVVGDSQLDSIPGEIPDHVQVWVLPNKLIGDLIGFDFHRGFLGCGRRKTYLDYQARLAGGFERHWTGVLLVGLQDPENLGLIARTCAAMGILDVFIGPGCVDPYARRVLRVSMGGMLNLNKYSVPVVEKALKDFSESGVQTIATTLADDSIRIEEFRRDRPTLIVLGNEAEGLPKPVQLACETRLRIDMSPDTDSLNVSVAAGIVLHYVTRLSEGPF